MDHINYTDKAKVLQKSLTQEIVDTKKRFKKGEILTEDIFINGRLIPKGSPFIVEET